MKDIAGYEGLYAITSCGKVWSYRNKKFLVPSYCRGYQKICLCKDGDQKTFQIHRLVAEAYIPNPQNLKTIDHIDGNKDHNYVGNLQWMSQEDNTRKAQSLKVRCVEKNQIFDSITIAAKEMGLQKSGISRVCLGKQKTCGGYHFSFVKEVIL